MKKITIFDLDGTLVDSSECIFAVYTALFKELNVEMPAKSEAWQFIGPPVEEMIAARYNGDVTAATKRFREIYKGMDFAATNRVYDGLSDLLNKLQDKTALYVGTTKNQFFAEKIMDILGISKYFIKIYGSDANCGRYTKTDVLKYLLKDTGANAKDCILIGDTNYDIEGSENTGIPVAIVRYGFGQEKDFVGKRIKFFSDTAEDLWEKLLKA